jgi:ABC-type glycerol-3-phosphate transport system substrate-binding protein
MGKTSRVLFFGLLTAVLLCLPPVICARAATLLPEDKYSEIVSTYSINDTIPSYGTYLSAHGFFRPDAEYQIPGGQYVRYEENGLPAVPMLMADADGNAGTALLTSENALVEYEVTAKQEGLYNIELSYYPCAGKATEIQRAFFVDGALPYRELALIEFKRIWVCTEEKTIDENGVTVRGWKKDNQGNDLKPSLIEAPEWITAGLYDSNGYITGQLSIYLTQGTHTITLLSLREPLLIGRITLSNPVKTDTYAGYKAQMDAEGAKETKGLSVRIEAETADKMSSQMLYPQHDSSSPAIYPESAKFLINNAIGGNSWRHAGQWIEWSFAVPEDGYYNISLYDKQNFTRGINVSRRIYIDGRVPFEEFASYPFPYAQSWRLDMLSTVTGTPYEVYLTEGTHTLRMEVVLGDMAQIISQISNCVLKLNTIYRQVLLITGVAPDKFRDYQIEASLPGLKDELVQVQYDLSVAIGMLKKTAGTSSDKLTVLKTMYDQLDELIFDQERFTEVISSYKINVRAVGNWITQVLNQPLEVDRIYIHSPDTIIKIDHGDWGSSALHELSRLYYSFVIDYNQIGNIASPDDKTTVITLWVSTGRDQANIIKALIDEKFTPECGVAVNVQLVDMNTLLRATLSGQGPDVAIQVANTNAIAGAVLNTGNDTPVNYGLRNAVLDLTQFNDFEEVAARFLESALVPFSFNGAAYALPDTLTFPMMFFRKDILSQIGLEVPKTWDDVKVAMSVLSKNQMEFGMLPSEQIFAMLLYQNGGQYYTENGSASMLDSDIAVNTFKKYCEYYTDYKLDKETSVEERFRTGECPIIISDYTTFNNLQVSAPDILGLWDFTVVPGTVKADGSILHLTGCSGLADIIMANTKNRQACWEFLKWWTSGETQTLYGREMESLMGASARVPTANLSALANLSWPLHEYRALSDQLSQVKGIPQVPGGYYSWRNVNNAFYTVTEDPSKKARDDASSTPREELMDKVYYINAEITYKRREFNLPVTGE